MADDTGHEWVVIVTYGLTEDEVIAAHTEQGGLTLGPEKAKYEMPPPFCFRCERLWIEVHDQPCPGDPIQSRIATEMALGADALRAASEE